MAEGKKYKKFSYINNEGQPVTTLAEVGKISTVEELLPKPAKNNQRVMGRPSLSEEHFKIVEDCLKLDCTISEACDYAGISVPTYYNHYNNDPDFALRMDRAKNFPKMMARTAVMKRIWQGDAKTALRYLELRDKNRYNTDINTRDEDEEQKKESKVQFISIPSNEGADQSKNDSQISISLSSASDTSATSGEKQTPRENEEEALRRLDSLNFSNE